MKYKKPIIILIIFILFSCKNSNNNINSNKPTIQHKIVKTNEEGLNANSKDSLKNKYKINKLPISYNYENDFMQISLPKDWINIKIETYYEDAFLAFLPKRNNFRPAIFTGIYALGNSDEFLIILDNNYNEISKLKLYFNDAPDGNVENYSYSTYQINKDYSIRITTYKINEDLNNNKIIKKDSLIVNYTINKKGLITKM